MLHLESLNVSHRECDVVSVYDSMLNFSSDSE